MRYPEDFMTFGNRAFYGRQTEHGNVVVIDSPARSPPPWSRSNRRGTS